MNRRELKRIYQELLEKMEELESAIYSDTESYSPLNVSYEDVLDYYNTSPNAEEGL